MSAYEERTRLMPSVFITYICVCERMIIRWHTLMPYVHGTVYAKGKLLRAVTSRFVLIKGSNRIGKFVRKDEVIAHNLFTAGII